MTDRHIEDIREETKRVELRASQAQSANIKADWEAKASRMKETITFLEGTVGKNPNNQA